MTRLKICWLFACTTFACTEFAQLNKSFPRDITSMWPSHIFTFSSLYEALKKGENLFIFSVLRAGDSNGKFWGCDTKGNTDYVSFCK